MEEGGRRGGLVVKVEAEEGGEEMAEGQQGAGDMEDRVGEMLGRSRTLEGSRRGGASPLAASSPSGRASLLLQRHVSADVSALWGSTAHAATLNMVLNLPPLRLKDSAKDSPSPLPVPNAQRPPSQGGAADSNPSVPGAPAGMARGAPLDGVPLAHRGNGSGLSSGSAPPAVAAPEEDAAVEGVVGMADGAASLDVLGSLDLGMQTLELPGCTTAASDALSSWVHKCSF